MESKIYEQNVNTELDDASKVTNDNNAESNIILNESDIEKKRKHDLIKEYYINLQKHKYERFIEITMNQTTYTRDEAVSSLEKHNGDITLVIKEFLGVTNKDEEQKKEKNSKSLHQKRYSVIREFMDNASSQFMRKQEETKRYNDFLERQKEAKKAKETKDPEYP